MIYNSKKNSVLFAVALAILFCTISFSCTDDAKITQTPVSDEYLSVAKDVLQDCIVLNATAMQGKVNKTLLDEGCPLRYYLTWTDQETLTIQIKDFSVGKMPVRIWFTINVKFMQLNTFEKDEYTGEGWIKFQGTGGNTVYTAETNEYQDGTGGSGSVTGYFNTKTHEIEFVTNFNVMNMSSDVFPQIVDPSRLEQYDEEFAQYEADLAQYKAENGL